MCACVCVGGGGGGGAHHVSLLATLYSHQGVLLSMARVQFRKALNAVTYEDL